MPRWEKWLTEVGPDAPVSRAARKALKPRLRAVVHFLKESAQVSGKGDDDAQAVHQLRIWTRRAGAALALFRGLLPRATRQWLARKLRQIRRAGGEARDCDLLAQRLEEGEVPGLEHAAVHLRSRRRRAEKELSRLYCKLGRGGKFERRADKLLRKISWPKGRRKPPKFGPWCRGQLAPLCDDFLKHAAADMSHDARLHELRLAGKRLRYALELAPAALPPATHRRLYEELGDLQDRLGAVCDRIAAVARLKQWRDECREAPLRKDLARSLANEKRLLAAAKGRFLRWWSAKRQAALGSAWKRALRGSGDN